MFVSAHDSERNFRNGARYFGSLFILASLFLGACGGGGGGSSQPPPGGSLSYPSGTQSFTVGTAITALNPTVTGTLSGFTVSPALPAGLSLDSSKGTISGTPTVVTATANYTVSAMVSGGTTTSGAVSIAVNDVPPSQLSYSAPSFTFSSTITSSTLTPTSKGGAVVSWSISPALPAGLNFSTTDGSISGTPTATAASASYVVTAQNSGGQGTVTLTIEVDGAPLLNLGHQSAVTAVRMTAANVLSVDDGGYWILWSYSAATAVASGNSGCPQGTIEPQGCAPSPAVDMSGPTAVIVTPTGFEARSSSDGHVLGTIAASARWWKLATDGSYIAAGNSTNLSAWSPSGQLLFSRSGDYSKAVSFAAPNQILVAAGPAGQNVVETIAVPSGTATTGPQFNGQFGSWFTDGGRFITTAGTTALIYSAAGVQQGSITPVNDTVVGQGNWVWMSSYLGSLNVYSATGNNQPPAVSYSFHTLSTAIWSGTTVGVSTAGNNTFSVIDLSGATPSKTDFTIPALISAAPGPGAFTAASASQWLLAGNEGMLLDGASLAGSPRYFGFGAATSLAGGTGHFAMATASGQILYFNSATLAQEGAIAFTATKVLLSADGSLLVAQGSSGSVSVYDLPGGGAPLFTTGGGAQDISLSGSGTVLGLDLSLLGTYTQEAEPSTGGSAIFSSSFVGVVPLNPPPIRISPDGTLIAFSTSGSSVGPQQPGTNLLHNGTSVTAFSGLPVSWLDNSRLVVNNYAQPPTVIAGLQYAGCTLYGPNGSPTGGACALKTEFQELQPNTADAVYAPATNQILSVSTGAVNWASGDPFPLNAVPGVGAVAGSHVVFVSGTNLLVQSY